MTDEQYTNPRLAALYDPLEHRRPDLDVYRDIARESKARQILDVGCGTGTLALLLAARGHEVTGVDPAGASLAVARAKPGADKVRRLHTDATRLRGVRAALRLGGWFVFETRDPARRAWEEWTPEESRRTVQVPGTGEVETWYEVTGVRWPLVTFQTVYALAATGETLLSESTLRFRERDEVTAALTASGFDVEEVRGAPDRPGKEFVFFARVVSPGGQS